MENQGTQENQVSTVPRVTQGCRAQKVTLASQDPLVSQAPWAQQELGERQDTMARLGPEESLEYLVLEVPLGRQAFQDSLEPKAMQELQGLLAQRA